MTEIRVNSFAILRVTHTTPQTSSCLQRMTYKSSRTKVLRLQGPPRRRQDFRAHQHHPQRCLTKVRRRARRGARHHDDSHAVLDGLRSSAHLDATNQRSRLRRRLRAQYRRQHGHGRQHRQQHRGRTPTMTPTTPTMSSTTRTPDRTAASTPSWCGDAGTTCSRARK